MTTKSVWAVILLHVVLGSTGDARADLIVSISSPDDLNKVAIGGSAEFDVRLSLSDAESVGFLTTSVQYDQSVFNNPVVQAGPIVPAVLGFESSGSGSGVVSAYYDDSLLGTSPITSDGLFFSFTLTRVGSLATTLFFSAFAAMDDSGNVISVSAAPDTILVGAAPMNAVPEPSSGMLALCALMLAACWRVCRRPLWIHRNTRRYG